MDSQMSLPKWIMVVFGALACIYILAMAWINDRYMRDFQKREAARRAVGDDGDVTWRCE